MPSWKANTGHPWNLLVNGFKTRTRRSSFLFTFLDKPLILDITTTDIPLTRRRGIRLIRDVVVVIPLAYLCPHTNAVALFFPRRRPQIKRRQ